jgi:hypothetical protein
VASISVGLDVELLCARIDLFGVSRYEVRLFGETELGRCSGEYFVGGGFF